MLVLTRKPMESVRISDNIAVTVLTIRGNKVRLGIEAPTEIPVHRTEVYEAISESLSLSNPATAPPGPNPNGIEACEVESGLAP
jgi:carbon storage regulator